MAELEDGESLDDCGLSLVTCRLGHATISWQPREHAMPAVLHSQLCSAEASGLGGFCNWCYSVAAKPEPPPGM